MGSPVTTSIETLLVDDEKSLLEQAKIFLEKISQEIKVLTVSSAERALDLLDKRDFDIIVSDYQMPGIDGLEFLEEVKEKRHSDIPFIMFTGKGREEVAIKALNLGADRYLQKGGDPKYQYEMLVDAIKQEFDHWEFKKRLKESEEEKSIILEATSDVIAFHDAEHDIIWANRSYLEGAGKSLEEMKGEKCYNAWYGRDEPCEGCPTDEALKSGEVEKGEISPPEGEKTWLITGTPITDEEGNITRIVETSLDITDQKKSERELKEREEKYRALVESAFAGIGITDFDDNFDFVNEKFADMLGYEKEEMLEKNLKEIAPEKEYSKFEQESEKRKEGKTSQYETQLYKKNGERIDVMVHASPFKNADGEFTETMGIVTDITEWKQQQRELKRKEKYIDHTPEYMTVLDEEGKIKYHSYPSEGIRELDPSKLIGDRSFEFIHPDDREKALEKFAEIVENPREEYRAELRGKTGDDWIWLEMRAVNHLDDPEIEGIIIAAQNITERKEAEKRIEKNKNKIERLHETSAEIQTCDREEEVYSLAIEAAEDILDFDICSFDAVEGDMFVRREISTGTPENGYTEKRIDEAGLASKSYLNKESYLVDDLLEDKDAKPVKSEYRSAISVPIGQHGVFQAVSTEVDHFDEEDLKTAELLISHVSQALERIKVKNREDFLHSLLRHDIGNKIQVIQGYIQLLEEDIDDDGSIEMIQKAEKATKEAQKLMEKVRTLKDVIAEHELGAVEVFSILNIAISNCEERLERQDIELECEKEEIKAQGGPLLKEVFSNILENAVKHAECDKIRISFKERDHQVVVSVEDDGLGIPDDIKEKIFERGYKSGEAGGSGLGLYLVKEIINGYGGDIEVKDSSLGGARFDVKLKRE